MFFKAKGDDVKDDKQDKLEQLKAFYPETKATLREAFAAVIAFKQEVEANSNSAETATTLFNEEKDKSCQAKISTVELTLEEDDISDELVKELHSDLQGLHSNLAAFKAADKDDSRQTKYQKAVELVDKLDEVCKSILPKHQSNKM